MRARVLGTPKMAYWDVLAPAPETSGGTPRLMPYEEGIGIVKRSLGRVNPDMTAFVDLMLENRWIDAKPSDRKVGGAFYSRFNEFRIPRVFSTYLGSITSVLQQGHELGHAFHYWKMRDLPMIETEFPMTLTETASTFNEAVIRRALDVYKRQPHGDPDDRRSDRDGCHDHHPELSRNLEIHRFETHRFPLKAAGFSCRLLFFSADALYGAPAFF